MSRRVSLTVANEVGLHARPAAMFVSEATNYQADIKIRNCTSHSAWVDAKSIVGVLMLGASQGHEVEIEAEGPDEDEAVQALQGLIESNFNGQQ